MATKLQTAYSKTATTHGTPTSARPFAPTPRVDFSNFRWPQPAPPRRRHFLPDDHPFFGGPDPGIPSHTRFGNVSPTSLYPRPLVPPAYLSPGRQPSGRAVAGPNDDASSMRSRRALPPKALAVQPASNPAELAQRLERISPEPELRGHHFTALDLPEATPSVRAFFGIPLDGKAQPPAAAAAGGGAREPLTAPATPGARTAARLRLPVWRAMEARPRPRDDAPTPPRTPALAQARLWHIECADDDLYSVMSSPAPTVVKRRSWDPRSWRRALRWHPLRRIRSALR